MQRLIIDVEDQHISFVVGLLSNLKQNIVKNIVVKDTQLNLKNNISKLDEFHRLIDKSNNKTKLTMKIATNTDEMVNDGIF